MTYNKVRKGSIYVLRPVLGDYRLRPYTNHLVRVVELPGCPRSRMPRCFAHVELLNGSVLGMVYTNSLVPASESTKNMTKEYPGKDIRQDSL